MPNPRGAFRGLILFFLLFSTQAQADLSADRQEKLEHLLLHDCGSCHGLTLKGGLGPPLTPGDLTEKPAEFLEEIIFHGMPDMAMPPWGELLTREEIRWLVKRIKSGKTP
ncbi:MAG: cytochrome c [Magnetococcales bacterium]|nr:cytochrome c [Magnetococcales bacterium]